MAWEWSHTPLAYRNARENFLNLPEEVKREIYSEWLAVWRTLAREQKKENPWQTGIKGFPDSRVYPDLITFEMCEEEAENVSLEILEEYVWELVREQRLCTNGGWKTWLCPFGCECHQVPFSREEREG